MQFMPDGRNRHAGWRQKRRGGVLRGAKFLGADEDETKTVAVFRSALRNLRSKVAGLCLTFEADAIPKQSRTILNRV